MLDALKRSSSIPQNLVFPTSGENRDAKMLVQLQEFRRWSRENRSHQRWLVPCRLAQRDAQRKHPAESCLWEHSQRDCSRCLPRPPALPPQNSLLPGLCLIPLLVKKSFSHTSGFLTASDTRSRQTHGPLPHAGGLWRVLGRKPDPNTEGEAWHGVALCPGGRSC